MRLGKSRIGDLLRLLRPHQASGFAKTRLGALHDGGYVLLDDFAGIERAVACGVGDDVSFELALAERGIDIDLFDHTVAGPPRAHERFDFHHIKVGNAGADDLPCVTLDGIAAMHRLAPGTALLKLDIEGDEWELLQRADPASLWRYRQIVCEVHWLGRTRYPSFLATALAAMTSVMRDFVVVHVHANNFQPMVSFGDLQAPSVMELTFASRRHYRLRPSVEVFPTTLDTPNNRHAPDHMLGRFDFPRRLTDFLPWR